MIHFLDEDKLLKDAVQEALDRDAKVVMSLKTGLFYEVPVSQDIPQDWVLIGEKRLCH